MAVMDTKVMDALVLYILLTVFTTIELTPLGNNLENNSSIELSVIGRYFTILIISMIKGKKEMIIKNAAWAE